MQSIILQRLSKDIVFMKYIIILVVILRLTLPNYNDSLIHKLMNGCHFHNFKYIVILQKGVSNQQFNNILVEIIES